MKKLYSEIGSILTTILPVDSYEYKGIYTFSPYQVLPVQAQNTGAYVLLHVIAWCVTGVMKRRTGQI